MTKVAKDTLYVAVHFLTLSGLTANLSCTGKRNCRFAHLEIVPAFGPLLLPT